MSDQIIATSPVMFQITDRSFVNALTTALSFASKDDTLPMISGVELKIHKGYLIATGTDRFRLGVLRSEITEFDGKDGRLGLLEYTLVRKLVAVMKPARRSGLPGILKIGVADEKLTVDNGSERFTVALPARGGFPDVGKIIDGVLAAEAEPLPLGWSVRPRYLASFAAAAKPNEAAMIRATTPNRPVLVTIGEDFLGIQMPMRMPDRKEGQKTPIELWRAFFEPVPEVKPARKRAPRKAASAAKATATTAAPKKRAPRKATA